MAGKGKRFKFHGAFAKKEDAKKRERSKKGSFIKRISVRGKTRYAVLEPIK